ncbi:hypothetical protein HDA37_005776 [Pseudonocardia antarctica]|jgi:hypothetical protein|uniref:Uncharacterized protein n=1 Tax=Pseudonocardia alni TaxID=33907 RepID=A0A852WJC3_PSEA5|nr:hypothetical protein [Pseudonocardia antarctica]
MFIPDVTKFETLISTFGLGGAALDGEAAAPD